MQFDPSEPELRLSRETCMRLLRLRVGTDISSDEWEEIWQECSRYLIPKTN